MSVTNTLLIAGIGYLLWTSSPVQCLFHPVNCTVKKIGSTFTTVEETVEEIGGKIKDGVYQLDEYVEEKVDTYFVKPINKIHENQLLYCIELGGQNIIPNRSNPYFASHCKNILNDVDSPRPKPTIRPDPSKTNGLETM